MIYHQSDLNQNNYCLVIQFLIFDSILREIVTMNTPQKKALNSLPGPVASGKYSDNKDSVASAPKIPIINEIMKMKSLLIP